MSITRMITTLSGMSRGIISCQDSRAVTISDDSVEKQKVGQSFHGSGHKVENDILMNN